MPYFCERCGGVKDRAPGGFLRCAPCGLAGLNRCTEADPPVQMKCPQRGCAFTVWQNEMSDDYLRHHLVQSHPRSQRAKMLTKKKTGRG